MQFVLIHGSWHDGSSWDGVRERLEADGHAVWAPTLPGNGDDLRADVTLDETVAAVVDGLAERDLTDVVLVGHSFGGVVVQKVAEAVPERLRRLVFHNAYVLADGQTVFDHIPAPSAEAFQALAEAAGDGTVSLPFEVFRDGFINDADLATARAAFATLGPEPLARAAEPVKLPDLRHRARPTLGPVRHRGQRVPRPVLVAPGPEQPARPLPAGADARLPRGDVLEPGRAGGQARRGGPGLTCPRRPTSPHCSTARSTCWSGRSAPATSRRARSWRPRCAGSRTATRPSTPSCTWPPTGRRHVSPPGCRRGR